MTEHSIVFITFNLAMIPLFVGAALLLLAVVCIRKPAATRYYLKELPAPTPLPGRLDLK